MISCACLELGAAAGATRVLRAHARAPQRWTIGAAAPPWLTVHHQLLGDGCFPGDITTTRYLARRGSRTVVSAVAATPLRPGRPSLLATDVRVETGAILVLQAGALLPHAAAMHRSLLRANVAGGGAFAHIQAIAPGRSAHEPGRYARLDLRTRITSGETLLLREEATLDPGDWPPGGPVVVAITVVGAWAPAAIAWWEPHLHPGRPIGAWPLRENRGLMVRAIFQALGEANAFVHDLVTQFRQTPGPDICCS